MKQFILRILALIGLVAGLAVSVSAYEPVFVQGRVWEYLGGIGPGDLMPIKYKVDGTVERFGKTYSVIRSVDNADTVALVREDNGKAWRLASSDWLMVDIRRYWSNSRNCLADVQPTDSTEYQLYDFSLLKGDSIQQVEDVFLGIEQEGKQTYGCNHLFITSIDSVLTSKGMMKRMKMSSPDLNIKWTIVEGLGYIENGWPYEPYFGSFTAREPFLTSINRVFDPDGSVVYSGRYGSSLAPGQKWVYWNADSSDINNGYYETLTLGEETVIGDTAYRVLRTDRSDKVAYVREFQNRVYKRCDDGSETLLYDFNMLKDDSFEYMEEAEKCNIKVSRAYYALYNRDRIWLAQNWDVSSSDGDTDMAIEVRQKAGVLKGGTFADFDFFNPARDITLLRVEDADDKQVFENEKSGVETITTNLPADGRMYDLMGREIREPQRGTVYIQDGRKKVKH